MDLFRKLYNQYSEDGNEYIEYKNRKMKTIIDDLSYMGIIENHPRETDKIKLKTWC